jgi:Rod binding domain-containing protein
MAGSISGPGLSQGSAAATLDRAQSAALKPLKAPASGKTLDPKDVKRTADDFETLFLEQMFNHMFNTIEVDKTTGGGQGEETVRSLLVNAYAKNVVKAGGVGLSSSIARDILKIQEQANAAAQQ